MTNNKNNKTKPTIFSKTQLSFFANELKEAGGFDELMVNKKALERIDGRLYILTYQNIEEYKEKYLTEEYKNLTPFYNTKVPYFFWCQMYITLKKNMRPSR